LRLQRREAQWGSGRGCGAVVIGPGRRRGSAPGRLLGFLRSTYGVPRRVDWQQSACQCVQACHDLRFALQFPLSLSFHFPLPLPLPSPIPVPSPPGQPPPNLGHPVRSRPPRSTPALHCGRSLPRLLGSLPQTAARHPASPARPGLRASWHATEAPRDAAHGVGRGASERSRADAPAQGQGLARRVRRACSQRASASRTSGRRGCPLAGRRCACGKQPAPVPLCPRCQAPSPPTSASGGPPATGLLRTSSSRPLRTLLVRWVLRWPEHRRKSSRVRGVRSFVRDMT